MLDLSVIPSDRIEAEYRRRFNAIFADEELTTLSSYSDSELTLECQRRADQRRRRDKLTTALREYFVTRFDFTPEDQHLNEAALLVYKYMESYAQDTRNRDAEKAGSELIP